MTAVTQLQGTLAQAYARDHFSGASREFDVLSPATGDVLGRAPDCDDADAARAVDRTMRGFESWRRRTAFDRARVMRAWHELIAANRQELACLIAAEVGKPIRQARAEVDYANAFVSWSAEEVLRLQGELLACAEPDRRAWAAPRPIGPAFGITPWNFPAAMPARTVAPALAAGCSIVLKPAEQSPLTAMALARLWEEAEGPPEAFQVLPCSSPATVSSVLLDDPRVRKLTFTGSHGVGAMLYRRAAETIKSVSLELGGHAPFLVFDDADVIAAAREAVKCKFRYGGQTCVCTNRIYVHERVADEFRSAYVEMTTGLRVGDPLDEETDVGPLIDEQALAKVEGHVADATAKGATVPVGGNALGGLFFEPTILEGVETGMRVMQEETFGPVAPIATFRTDAEAVRLANDTPYGLAAYFWTRDVGRLFTLAEDLDAGIIGANDGVPGGSAHVPFGGVKQSGVGRAGGRWGLEEYLEPKYVSVRLPTASTRAEP
jgi:succinate-semialdehyde dehydrogenase / glutarate-semialdehyde dehydrogenase